MIKRIICFLFHKEEYWKQTGWLDGEWTDYTCKSCLEWWKTKNVEIGNGYRIVKIELGEILRSSDIQTDPKTIENL